jgi:hypothetical protein
MLATYKVYILNVIMDKELLSALVTFVVGFVAIYTYVKSRNDSKRDAAKSIMLEVQQATRRLKSAKENPDLTESYQLMPSESWSKYRQLFVNDFTAIEWDELSDFYEKCHEYDRAVISDTESFSKNEEQIRINAHRVTADYTRDALAEITKEYREKGEQIDAKGIGEFFKAQAGWFDQYYLRNGSEFIPRMMYTPQKYKDDRLKFLKLINDSIPTNNIGAKIERLSKRRWYKVGL